jgi:hypothetical protein
MQHSKTDVRSDILSTTSNTLELGGYTPEPVSSYTNQSHWKWYFLATAHNS